VARFPRTDDSAAHAANWRTILAVDAVVGLAVVAVGVVVLVVGSVAVGAAVTVAGSAYVVMVGRRARRWRALRAGGRPDG